MQLSRTKEWREARGLTQRELAAEAGVGEATVARIESGVSVRPNTARKLAEALKVSVADLMEAPPVPLGKAPEGGFAYAFGKADVETYEVLAQGKAVETYEALRGEGLRFSSFEEALEALKDIRERYGVEGESLALVWHSDDTAELRLEEDAPSDAPEARPSGLEGLKKRRRGARKG